MTRITKEIAQEVAVRMTEKKKNEIESLHKKLKDTVHKYVEKQIPKDVLSCFKKNKGYFHTRTSFQFIGNEFNYESYSCNSELPYSKYQMAPDVEAAKAILQIKHEMDKKNTERNSLKNEIEVALYNLKTYNAVEAEFPEAFKLLPKRITQALTVNIKSIREKL